MANTTLKTRIILNNKTEAEWIADNTFVPLKGEMCVYTDLHKAKVGDGVTVIADLPFAWLTQEDVDIIVGESTHVHNNLSVLQSITAAFTTALKDKLDKIADGAEANVQSDWTATDTNSDAYIKNVPSWVKSDTKPTYTATEVGADASGSATQALTDAKGYTDQKIADLIDGAPETMDTLKEVSDAIADNKDVVDALNEAIGKKANASDLTSHTGNTTVHITATERTDWNAAKTHADSAHAPSDAEKNVIIGVKKNGADLTPDASRKVNITVPEAIADITGLQDALDGKAPTEHGTHVTYATVVGKAPGTAAVGTSAKVAREDHVHPVQTTVSGNAGTATKLSSAKTISADGAVTATGVSFDGSQNATINITALNAGKLTQDAGDVLILDGSF